MAEPGPCAWRSRQADEDLAGTASTVRRWLLVEQPGPWGPDALRESRLDPEVSSALARLGRELGVRVLLIRRHGRETVSAGRSAFAAVSAIDARWVERIGFRDPAELLEWDWAPLADGHSVGGHHVPGPLLLVCTNGRHDACCARLGRPLAAALSAVEPEATWEASHFGGDRFAGNVVCLPDGLYYGRVGPHEAADVAAALRERRLCLRHLRGRSSLPFATQAAEIAVRRHTGLDGIDELRLAARQRLDEHTVRATFQAPDGTAHTAVVHTSHDPEPRPLSCGAEPVLAPRFEAQVLAPTPPDPSAGRSPAGP